MITLKDYKNIYTALEQYKILGDKKGISRMQGYLSSIKTNKGRGDLTMQGNTKTHNGAHISEGIYEGLHIN